MNLALLGLTIFVVVLVLGTTFWLIGLLVPLHKKQKMRKAEALRQQAVQRETQSKEQSKEQGRPPAQKEPQG
ncbi:hypothetical protein [Congregibacter sp.]|uniref:hypothetical protein n=1 Tax=Congregibacter sp. TaxID=2744308 RepID=UPI003F6AD72E